MTTYPLYGLEVACDRPLDLWSHPARADLLVQQGPVERAPRCIHDLPDPGGEGRLRLDTGDGWTLEYDGWRFAIGADAITYQQTDDHRSPFGLVLERVVVPLHRLVQTPTIAAFHGSAVVSQKDAFVFIGDSGSGKSTTARLAADAGAHLATDDLALVDAVSRELFPGAHGVRSFDPVPTSEPVDLYADSPKKWYPLPGPPPPRARLRAIVHLERSDGWGLAPVKGATAGVLLLRHAFDLQDPPGEWRERRMRNVMEIGRTVPLLRATYPTSPGAPDHGAELMQRIRTFLDPNDPSSTS